MYLLCFSRGAIDRRNTMRMNKMKHTEQTWIIFRLAKIWRRKIAIWGSIYVNFVVRRLHCIKYVLLIIILERCGQQKERKLLVKDWLCKRINYKIFRELWFLLLFLLWIDLSNLTEKTRLQMSNDNRLITWNTLWKLVAYLDWQTSQISLQEEKSRFLLSVQRTQFWLSGSLIIFEAEP